MKIVVCVKPVKGELNPFDESALECALQMKNAEITVLSMGVPSTVNILKRLTRLDVEKAVLLTDNAFAGADTLATAYTLSLAIKKLAPDMVVCGRQSIDGDTAQTGPCLAQMLGMPVITNVLEITGMDEKIECVTRQGTETAGLPVLITVEKIGVLRFPSIRSKVKEVELWNACDINADTDKCGSKGSPTKVIKTYTCNTGQRKCEFISPDELMDVIEKERNRPRTDMIPEKMDAKLENVWVIGGGLGEIASHIARDVTVIEKCLPEEIAALAQMHKPEIILWPGDLWGRRNAPVTAAILQTGLCADCTHLETDGENFYMYRPAFGGNLMAKIRCDTRPQMATVRIVQNAENEIIVSGGKGVKNDISLLKAFAKSIGASVGASRGLVDMELAPYETQIGLTGKSVSPKIYIALGISGAVHHTCAIETANVIIAVNPDKNARIFSYADYGILGKFNRNIVI